ncbi:MAG: hypothetical protein RLZZ344_1122 [Pseudomonadota bacterium]
MALFKFLKPWSADAAGRPKNRMGSADHMADAIGLELKGIVSQAVLASLEEKQAHYLTSILEKSVFLIDSVVITPQDKDAATALEKFLRLHSEIDPGFKTQFFRSILEKEYRSERGATVLVAPDMQPSVQFNEASLESPSDEESFQISLRGRRLSYVASISLKGPVAKTNPIAQSAQQAASAVGNPLGGSTEPFIGGDTTQRAGGPVGSQKASPTQPASTNPGPIAGHTNERLVLRIHDEKGERQIQVQSPLLIGRESPPAHELGALQFVALHGTFVSRRHLVVVSVGEDTYFFLHDAATLSCLTSSGQMLRPGSLYSIARHAEVQLVFGVTPDAKLPASEARRPSEFPVVEICRLGGERRSASLATPRPKAL